MKLNAHNNPPSGKRKPAAPSAPAKHKHHDPAVTERNRLKRIAKDERLKRKAEEKKAIAHTIDGREYRTLHVPHGSTRFIRRMEERKQNALTLELRRLIVEQRAEKVITDREKAIEMGLITPRV